MTDFVNVAIHVAGRAIVDPSSGAPTAEFLRALNDNVRNLKVAINQLAVVAEDIKASIEAAGIALTTAEAVRAELEQKVIADAVLTSYVEPNRILSSDIDPADSTLRTITIADHTRKYGDGQQASVTGSTLSGLAPGALYFVYYDDEDREGGAVSYVATMNSSQATQTRTRHTVGSITTVAPDSSGPTTGGGTTGPGIPPKLNGYEIVPEFD